MKTLGEQLFGRPAITSFRDEYTFLSNFYPCNIEFEGFQFNSVECAYVAAKTLDIKERFRISAMLNAGKAKKYGRTLDLRPDWDEIKLQVMEDLVTQKFQIPELKEKLLATEDANLIEGNWWGDKFWGVDSETGIGKNHLGEILMKVRSIINNQ